MTGSTLRRISPLALTLPLGLIAVAWLLNPGPPPGRRMAAADDRFAANQTASGATDPKPPAGRPDELPQVGYPGLESPHVDPLAVSGNLVFVTNTPAGTIDVLDIHTHAVIRRIAVGVDPVCIAVRPDGREIWVANHVSDSVSVIDADPQSATYLHVIATVQDLDPETRATRFDEPAGIAFAGDSKAYVALSSTNQIAVVDVATRRVTGRLNIPAQEPRAIAVRGPWLYVLPFESGNQTQLSGGKRHEIDGDLVTFDAWEHSISNNNVLSLGHVVDLVRQPRVPDRDLLVFDTRTDTLAASGSSLGTLLYGLAVTAQGQVFVAQTDARNDVNGRSGTRQHGLKELENRAFLNRVTRVDFDGQTLSPPRFFDLEPLPPNHPAPGEALATPYALAVSPDQATLVATAAASDRLCTLDAETGRVLGRVTVGAGPRGVALRSDEAWVFNALDNSVSVVDLRERETPRVIATVPLADPTDPQIKRGRIAFNTARGSTTQTFSCASCHPDGHTDQLLWVLATPVVSGGNQIMPRSTMPARGLRDTAPFHWDGIPGDPYGGINSGSIHRAVAANSQLSPATSSTRHLVDGGLASTMRLADDQATNDEGLPGALSRAERDDMAVYLNSIPYPPAPSRAYTDVLSDRAQRGFRLFHVEGDHDPKQPTPNLCGNCHRLPFLVSTNTPGTGMDAPTWRGAQDRWLILPQGRLNIIDFDFYRNVAEQGAPEREIWRFSWAGRERFDPVWNMVLEMSTGFSGAFARQAALTRDTASDPQTNDLLDALERAASEGTVVLECDGVFPSDTPPRSVRLAWHSGAYVERGGDQRRHSRAELLQRALAGEFLGIATARPGRRTGAEHPQPALWTLGPIERQRGRQEFPILHPEHPVMTMSGRHFDNDARLFVDGRRVAGSVRREPDERVSITLVSLPAPGLHFLQVQIPDGHLSNEFLFHVAADGPAAETLRRELAQLANTPWAGIPSALAKGNLDSLRRLVGDRATANRRLPDGSTPLSTVVFQGHAELVRYLLDTGADPSGETSDGNTPLHIAAFLCREELVQLLLERGGDLARKNRRGETPVDVVSGEWTRGLADFYTRLAEGLPQPLDLEKIEEARPRMKELLSRQRPE